MSDAALSDLKVAHASQDVDGCTRGIEALNAAFQAASADMYAAQQQSGDAGSAGTRETADAEVTDVDFEEVK